MKTKSLLMVGALLLTTSAFAQKNTFKGVVVDDQGEPVIGASVVQKGVKTGGTVTDLEGHFTIQTDGNAPLVISYVGCKNAEVKLGPNLRVVLQQDDQTLDDVVVIGYGVQKKSVVTASIAKIGADELGKTAPVRVDGALKGLVSGVQVTTAGGQPGAASKIRIRGTGTVNDSDPLYIVDGMPVSGGIDYLNPSDIQSIEVLKDAASGAVYGTRAANGVVLITTKTGLVGKPVVKYDFSMGWQNPWRKRKLLNAAQYTTLMKEAAAYAGDSNIDATLASFGNSDTNWQDVLYNDNAPVQTHQLSISGATDRLNYYLSLGYYKSDGVIGGDYGRANYERLTVRSNTTYTLFDESKNRNWLKSGRIGANIAYSRINNTSMDINNLTGGSALGNAMFLSPLMSVYPDDPDALLSKYAGEAEKYGPLVTDKKTGKLLNVPTKDFNEISNPLAWLSQPGERHNSDKIVSTFWAEFGLWDNLKFKTSYGLDLSFWGTDGWEQPYYMNAASHKDKSSVWSSMNRGMRWQVENTLSYDKQLGQHSIAVVLGQSAISYNGRQVGGSAEDMVALDGSKANLDFTTGLKTDGKRDVYGGALTPHTLASYFGRLSYNYAERYMAQFTIRRDGSSYFGANHKWGSFPSVSLGWNVMNEKFMASAPDWLSRMKVRMSWGKNGNEPSSAFLYAAFVSMGNNYAFGGAGAQTVYGGSKPSVTPNADLKWEESEQYDAGIDLGFFHNALTVTVDWFKKKTNGMLKAMSVCSYLGESKPWGNVGKMENSGVEFEVGYKFRRGDWAFNVNANASYLKNKLIDLGSGSYETSDNVHQIGNVSRAENGYPYPFFYGYKTAGIFQNQEQVNNYVNDKGEMLQPHAEPGDVIFVDYNHDGKIDDGDKTQIGKGDPDWTFGLNFNTSYKWFDFSMLWTGSFGNDIFDATRRVDLRYVNLPEEFIDRWHGEGTSNTMPRFAWSTANDNNKVSDLYIKNGSYVRLKNVQLGFTLPKQWTKTVFISDLRFYVAAENLLTLTGYKGMEPEIYNGTQSGIDRGFYPQNRTITIGANVTF